MGNRLAWIILLMCLLGGVTIQAQEERAEEEIAEESVSLLEVTADLLYPNLKYGQAVDNNILGFSGALLFKTKSKTYGLAGIEASYYSMGSLTNTILSGGDQFTDFTRSNYASIKFLYRLYAPFYTARIEPFLEAGLGPHLFYTMTTTTFFDDESSSNIVVDEAALGLSYGLAVGATVAIQDQFFALIKLGIKGGTATRFLYPQNEVTSQYPIDNFQLSNDPLSILQLSLGVSYSF